MHLCVCVYFGVYRVCQPPVCVCVYMRLFCVYMSVYACVWLTLKKEDQLEERGMRSPPIPRRASPLGKERLASHPPPVLSFSSSFFSESFLFHLLHFLLLFCFLFFLLLASLFPLLHLPPPFFLFTHSPCFLCSPFFISTPCVLVSPLVFYAVSFPILISSPPLV